jgi:hypothetical protein
MPRSAARRGHRNRLQGRKGANLQLFSPDGRRRGIHVESPRSAARAGGDELQDVPEQMARDGDLGHLERDVVAVADDLRADLDELLAQARERPALDRLRHCKREKEVSKIVSQCVQLKQNRVCVEGATRKARPLDRTFALFDPLLARAPLVVKGDVPPSAPCTCNRSLLRL